MTPILLFANLPVSRRSRLAKRCRAGPSRSARAAAQAGLGGLFGFGFSFGWVFCLVDFFCLFGVLFGFCLFSLVCGGVFWFCFSKEAAAYGACSAARAELRLVCQVVSPNLGLHVPPVSLRPHWQQQELCVQMVTRYDLRLE